MSLGEAGGSIAQGSSEEARNKLGKDDDKGLSRLLSSTLGVRLCIARISFLELLRLLTSQREELLSCVMSIKRHLVLVLLM